MARAKRDAQPEVALSASGLTRLADCEVRFLWRPEEDAPELAKSIYLDLGTAVHALVEDRMRGRDWRVTLDRLAADVPGWEPGYHLPAPLPTAQWLMERHEQHWPTMPQVLATESQFELWLPDAPVPTKVRGRNDGLVLLTQADIDATIEDMGRWAWSGDLERAARCKPGVYLWETKTFGKTDRLDWLQVDPQLGTYAWAAEELGFQIEGVLYDGIHTQVWKTEEGEVYKTGPRKGQPKGYHPPADSFYRLVIPPNPALVEVTLDTYRQASARVAEIQADPSRAVRSMGRGCMYCPAYKSCFPHA